VTITKRKAVTHFTWDRYLLPNGPWVPGSTTLTSRDEERYSKNHGVPIDTRTDDGGLFYITSTVNDIRLGKADHKNLAFRGGFAIGGPAWSYVGFPTPINPTTQLLYALGTKASANCDPTNPAFSAPVALGELMREGVPSVPLVDSWRERTLRAKNAGSEYLNVEFGWKPLVSEIMSFANAATKSESILRGYHQGSGKKIRRGFTYPGLTQTKTESGSFAPVPTEMNQFLTGSLSDRSETKQYFSGCFQYYLNTSSDKLNRLSARISDFRKLYGVELTPEVLWNLTPWSWALDWFFNIGDVIHNISSIGRDGMTMQYGYMMSGTTRTLTMSAALPSNLGGASTQTIRTQKALIRVPASPYGFGMTSSQLTAKQSAVLVALGLTKT
jgi:hypothetical protein